MSWWFRDLDNELCRTIFDSPTSQIMMRIMYTKEEHSHHPPRQNIHDKHTLITALNHLKLDSKTQENLV